MIHMKFIESTEMNVILPFLRLLNDQIPLDILQNRLKDMVKNSYQCIGVYDDDKLIGICGIWILVKYYVGKHLEVDDVVILPEYRGKNIGKELMQYVKHYAKENDCLAIELNCYVHNQKGNKFWRDGGFKQIGNHFQKKL